MSVFQNSLVNHIQLANQNIVGKLDSKWIFCQETRSLILFCVYIYEYSLPCSWEVWCESSQISVHSFPTCRLVNSLNFRLCYLFGLDKNKYPLQSYLWAQLFYVPAQNTPLLLQNCFQSRPLAALIQGNEFHMGRLYGHQSNISLYNFIWRAAVIWDFVSSFVCICCCFRTWPWKGWMVCVTETGSGAAHPHEKLGHPWICAKCRSSGDSWEFGQAWAYRCWFRRTNWKIQSNKWISRCIQKVIKFLIKLSACYKLDSGLRYVPRGQNCNSGLWE